MMSSSPCGSWCQVFVHWYVDETMYYLEEPNKLIFGPSCLQCFPFKVVQHQCHATSVMISIGDIPGGSSLDQLNLLDILLGVGTPCSGTIFQQRSAELGTISSGLDLFVVDP